MPTAIAYIFSGEGFVIAADGLNTVRGPSGPETISRCAQKIFGISGINRQVSCSFIGMVALFNEAGEMVFNFVSACTEAARALESVAMRDANDLAAKMCPIIRLRLKTITKNGELNQYPSPETSRRGELGRSLVRIFLDGYFDGQPFRAGARFYHDDQKLGWTMFPHDLSRRRETVLFGANLVGGLLFNTEDPRLEEFRTDSCRTIAARYRNPDTAVNLQDAIGAARSFITACSSPVAKEIEGWDYQRIGGEPHIATITPKEGFHWSPRPEQFDAL